MKRTTVWVMAVALIVTGILVLGQRRGGRGFGGGLEKPPAGKSDAEKRVLGVIAQARAAGEVHLEVPDTDGRMLRVLTESIGARNVVEVGTSTGYSGLWLSLALQNTGGKMTTFELDPRRAAQARKHFQQAGVDGMISVVEGDARQNVKNVKGPIDLVFIDADKEGYPLYLQTLLPHVRPGGLILAHNIDSNRDYVEAITTNPDLDTVFYMQGAGLGITLKKR